MSKAKERLLQTAETLFHAHGYQAVTMRDVADALGVRQASLYYHVPDGKEQLFVEVMARSMARHQNALETAVSEAGPDLERQLTAVVAWIVAQPNFKLMQMFETDVAALSTANAQRVTQNAYAALFAPLSNAFQAAMARGEIRSIDPDHMAGLFLAMMDGVMYTTRARHTNQTPQALAEEMVDVLLNGLRLPAARAQCVDAGVQFLE